MDCAEEEKTDWKRTTGVKIKEEEWQWSGAPGKCPETENPKHSTQPV